MTVQAVEVKSENVAGVVQTTVLAGEQMILGINLDAFDPADQNLLGILGGQLTQGTTYGYGSADQVIMWADGGYKGFAMKDDQFYSLGDWVGGTPTNPAVVPGQGFWLKSAGTQIDVVLTGQAVESVNTSNLVNEGFQFLAYPFSCKRNIQDTGFVASGAKGGTTYGYGSADQIIFWTGSAYNGYALKESTGKWYALADYAAGPEADVEIDLSQGFWYKRVIGEGSFYWSEDNPYDENL
jgi:hypothetical protein